MASDVNQEGKKAVNISFKDVNDREWGLYMFKGKYVLIDVWLLGVDLVNIRFPT